MAILLLQALVFAVLLSGITLAVFGAAQGTGGLLSPIRIWLERFGKSEAIQKEVNEAIDLDYKAKFGDDRQAAKELAKNLAWWICVQSRYAIWRKPLLLCAKCMPSLWGILLAFPMCIWCDLTIPAALFGICFSSLINTKIQV